MLSKQAFASEYEFQKIFSIVTGITEVTISETDEPVLAGEDILLTDMTLLSIG